MENWRLVCLLVILAAILPMEPAGATDGRRRGPAPKPGIQEPGGKMGEKPVPFAYLAAASVAAC